MQWRSTVDVYSSLVGEMAPLSFSIVGGRHRSSGRRRISVSSLLDDDFVGGEGASVGRLTPCCVIVITEIPSRAIFYHLLFVCDEQSASHLTANATESMKQINFFFRETTTEKVCYSASVSVSEFSSSTL